MKEHTLLVQRIEQTNKGSLRTTYLKVVHEDENVRFHILFKYRRYMAPDLFYQYTT